MSKDRERLRLLHERLIGSDPSAPSELFVDLQKPLARVMYGRFRDAGLSWSDAADIATDAIVAHLSAPHRFQPERASLFTYLVVIANGDALNLIRDRGKERKNYARLVELSAADGNITDDGGCRRLDAEKLLRTHIDEIAETDMDRRVLDLMLQGEQETAAYAVVLEIEDLPAPEQRSLVKQHRDKIEKRLKRLGERL